MSKVTGYEYPSITGGKPALISHEQYNDGSNIFITFLPESHKTETFHVLENAEKFIKENGFIIDENTTKTDDIPEKTLKSLTEDFNAIVGHQHKLGRYINDTPTKFSQALVKSKNVGVDDARSAQRRAIFDLSYNQKSPFKNEQTARAFLDSEHGAKLATHYKNVANHPEFDSMVRKFGYTTPSVNESMDSDLSEATAPGMEDWVVSNKKKFIDQYGKKKGLQVLYATAWKIHDDKKSGKKSLNEMVMDRVYHPEVGAVEWRNEGDYHTISTQNKETGAQVIHALGNGPEVARKWKSVKEKLLKESNEWIPEGGIDTIAESIAANFKE